MDEFPRTPEREDCVKRLFAESANTSEYYSQSSDENNTSSQPFISPDTVQASTYTTCP